MFILQAMTPATATDSANQETLATFERAVDAQKILTQFNPLPEDEKFKLKRKQLIAENVLENGEEITKVVTIKNKYTIMFIEQV